MSSLTQRLPREWWLEHWRMVFVNAAALVGLLLLVTAAAIVHPALGFAAAGVSLIAVAFVMALAVAEETVDGNEPN